MLEHTALVVEGAMRLHNFKLDYRESWISSDDTIFAIHAFQYGYDDNGKCHIILGHNSYCQRGNIPNEEINESIEDLKLRDTLKHSYMYHVRTRPRKE